eukprot:m.271232 g.271232  ORF g.271232 m.271232 type:complete len:71 (+) comp40549_c0_seq26:65-277(+)
MLDLVAFLETPNPGTGDVIGGSGLVTLHVTHIHRSYGYSFVSRLAAATQQTKAFRPLPLSIRRQMKKEMD